LHIDTSRTVQNRKSKIKNRKLMDILRIATAGSVDDGKSTLIGRLLYETRSVTQDKLDAIDAASKRRGVDFLDLSLLTDGLIAEREQGITIDVAHVFFQTATRKYIIADTPGHFEYTRNMVTGASTAAASIILIDARNGLVEQTHRHYAIAALLRIPTVIVCINKMDLVGYSQARFDEIVAGFNALATQVRPDGQKIDFIPASSLLGENITRRSANLPWYAGPTLLELLEDVDAVPQRHLAPRLQVQTVIRPRAQDRPDLHDYRAVAGRVGSGVFSRGDEVIVLPNQRSTRITAIEHLGERVSQAEAGQSVSVHLADDIDVSRGALIALAANAPSPRKELNARLCWLDQLPLQPGKVMLLQHGVNRVRAKVQSLQSVIDVVSLKITGAPAQLRLNEMGDIVLKLAQPIFADAYSANPSNGAFILIDELTHATAGVGFIEEEKNTQADFDMPLGFGV
jgi:sulfate adenylyltransferase subunit 1